MRIDNVTVLGPVPSLWKILGDEYLAEFNFMSRTAAPDWAYLPLTPCVFRFSYKPEAEPTQYRVNMSELEQQHIRTNNYDGDGQKRCENYLFAGGTCYFNGDTYPNMLYGFQANNIIRGLEWTVFEGSRYLKFLTVKPTDNVSHMTYETHPWLVHRWDLISGRDKETTRHTNITPRGLVYNFLVSKEGYGFIPEKNVERFTGIL